MLHFSSVAYTYPHAPTPAVRDITFSLRPGEALLCTGRSGCGKSTLARLANGLAPHYLGGGMEGEVRTVGQNTRQSAPAQLAREAGTLFQDPESQFFALNVEDELGVALRWRGWEDAAVREAVSESAALLGIEDLLERPIFGLSEGQKQKTALAALLAAQPKLLVLDEPSANLDPESTAELARILLRLKEKGISLFIADHRLGWLSAVADRVLVLDAGRIAAEGPFALLRDAELRRRHGLRAPEVHDPRPVLPEAGEGDEAFFCCHELNFAYPKGKNIFTQAHFAFAPGRVTALLGENGVGKTTLARLLTGLERPQGGRVLAGGRVVKPRRLPRHAQVVLQNAGHQLRMHSARAELEDALPEGLAPGERRRDALAHLERYALQGLAERHPQSLSGGEKQRLAVACATVRKPRMLILDEPTSGLDGENMRRMADSMQQAARDGACLLVITHDLELMELACADKITLPS
ncbi:MAG: ABC transporter ATP-binding protein [Deltaproteobacteria bacterium]|jgi:energy-coupling factor transport system ATP-binding protein|nr:ABC transporter ATP-binding protein [Deltaproteobacteria bacterium]